MIKREKRKEQHPISIADLIKEVNEKVIALDRENAAKSADKEGQEKIDDSSGNHTSKPS